MRSVAQSLLAFARKHDLLQAGNRVGVAVSGGADSVALLRILVQLRQESGIVLSVVHLNHKLRGAESDTDEQFVHQLATIHQVDFTSESADVSTRAAGKKLSLEAAARELRYEFFNRLLETQNLDKIATAHTLDDQAETVLLKLVRGAGTRGLAGIYPKISCKPSASGDRAKAIVRPLLSTPRSEIEAYLREIGQEWREDSTNRDLRHTRNRIRHEILPVLAAQLNPSIRETLAEAAEIARGEEHYWSEKISALLPQVSSRKEDEAALDWNELRSYPLAVQRRVVRVMAESLGLGLEFRHIEDVLHMNAQRISRVSLPNNWSAEWRNGKVHFQMSTERPADYEYELPVPGSVEIPEAGVLIEVCLGPNTRGKELPSNSGLSHTPGERLFVRNWRAADRFWPAHSKRPRKIKELLQDRHITGEQKSLWPVIVSRNEVVWVRGLGVGHRFEAKNGNGLMILDSSLIGMAHASK